MRACRPSSFLPFVVAVFLFILVAANPAGTSGALRTQSPSDFTITGVVRDPSGQGISRMRVCAADRSDTRQPHEARPPRNDVCRYSDDDGKFTLPVIKAGSYDLIPEKSADGYYPPRLPYFRDPATAFTTVTLDESNRNAFAAVYPGLRYGLIVGKSVDESTNLPVESVTFTVCHAEHPRVCWSTSIKGEGGDFRVPAARVPFTLKATADGYEEWIGLGGMDPAGTPISVGAGSETRITMRMRRKVEALTKQLNELEKREGVNLPAPRQRAPEGEALFDHYPRVTKLEWLPVEGAVSYNVEVDYCDGMQKGIRECHNPQPLTLRNSAPPKGITGTSYEFYFVGAQPGRWRVWAVDGEGGEGFKSLWRTFVYSR